MIELTIEQMQALRGQPEIGPLRVVNPQTKELFVLLPLVEFERLTQEDDYDDSPWTAEEMEALAWHAGTMIGWDDMDEYDEDES